MLNSQSRLLAIDPSLTSTGWALFSVADGNPTDIGLVKAATPKLVLSERLQKLQEEVEILLDSLRLGAGDILICEGPAHLVLNPQSAIKVEHVRGIFETTARSRRVVVPGRLNPRTVQSEILGLRGKQRPRAEVKASAQIVGDRLYGAFLRERLLSNTADGMSKSGKISQDIIDALLIGTVAVARAKHCAQCSIDLLSAFSLPFQNPRGRSRKMNGRGWRDLAQGKVGEWT